MKDLQNNWLNHCGQSAQKYVAPKDTLFKDVVIIGNGPSGISLSYMLSGHWPYWLPEKVQRHPDEVLRARLDYADATKSLVEHDLVELAEGLEGRSTNPVSLLLDNLAHPCADLGMELPSMLHFKYRPEKQIDHIVLGKGPPGGAWHRMDPNLRTLSLSSWMSLPGFDFPTWERLNPVEDARLPAGETRAGSEGADIEKSPLQRRNLALQNRQRTASNSIEVQTRALISRVAEYYESYVHEMGLEKNFWNDVVVTNVIPIRMHGNNRAAKHVRWLVIGTRKGKQIHIACRNVVMANGSSDLANRLGLRVENLSIPWLQHELPQLEAALVRLSASERSTMKPVLIVGAGLSAADAVTICRQSGIPVIHVYRSRTAGLDKMLPENVYPEYHEVHKMMKEPTEVHDYYTPVPEHAIADLHPVPLAPGVHRVTVRHLVSGELRHFEVSFCAILIGARPDLRFLHSSLLTGPHQHHHHHQLQQPQQQSPQHFMSPLVRRTENGQLKERDALQVFDCYVEEECCSGGGLNSAEDQKMSRLAKQISWLKVFCAKCRHINLCERARRNDYKRICGHNYLRCECPVQLGNTGSLRTKQAPYETATKTALASAKVDDVALGLGEDPKKPIDGKNNPIAVDKFTNKVLRAPQGLYAIGPLVGDNFVRFIPGGALAITAALHREND